MMEKKRKIEKVVRKVSFAEAEEADNLFWRNASEEERLKSLLELRQIFFAGRKRSNKRIAKVVFKRNIHEEGQGS